MMQGKRHFTKRYVADRRHESCGGRVVAEVDSATSEGLFNDCDSIECELCGAVGEIFVDDGGVELIWHKRGNKVE